MVLSLLVSSLAAARPACSRSEQLYQAAKSAGVTINGTWVTLPKAPQWEMLVPLYDLLKDYDASVAYGNDCKTMVRRLRQKVIDRIRLYGTFLTVNVNDPLNRLRGSAVVTIDGVTVATAEAGAESSSGEEELPGHVIFRGSHQVKLKQPMLQPGERLVLEAKLDGKTIGKGEALEFALDIPPNSSDGPVVHTLSLGLGIKRSCKVRLRVSGDMLGPPRAERPQFVAEVYNPRQFTNQRLQNGDYLFSAGEYTLSLKLNEGQLPKNVGPRVIVDDAQVGLKTSTIDGVPTWQRRLSLSCPADQAQGETILELGFTGGRRAAVTTVEDSPEQSSPSVEVPVLTWVGLGALGTGVSVAAISHFGYRNPAQTDADYLYGTYDCANGSQLCGEDVREAISEYYDTRDTASVVTTTGLVVGGVGAVVAAAAWLLAEPASDHTEAAGLQLVPVVQRASAAVYLTGTF